MTGGAARAGKVRQGRVGHRHGLSPWYISRDDDRGGRPPPCGAAYPARSCNRRTWPVKSAIRTRRITGHRVTPELWQRGRPYVHGFGQRREDARVMGRVIQPWVTDAELDGKVAGLVLHIEAYGAGRRVPQQIVPQLHAALHRVVPPAHDVVQ